jgi:hypothetical protein
MMEQENRERDDFDALLDQALTGYGEPVFGMEERVLAQVRGAHRLRVLWWAAGSVAAAIAFAAMLLLPLYRQLNQVETPSAIATVSALPSPLPRELEPQPPTHVEQAKVSPERHHRVRVQPVVEKGLRNKDPGNRVPFPLIVREDGQERALRIALMRPGFLAVLDEASRAAASREQEEMQESKTSEPPPDNTQIDFERK